MVSFPLGPVLIQADLVLLTIGVKPDMLQSRPLSFSSEAHSHLAVRVDSWKPGGQGKSVTCIVLGS